MYDPVNLLKRSYATPDELAKELYVMMTTGIKTTEKPAAPAPVVRPGVNVLSPSKPSPGIRTVQARPTPEQVARLFPRAALNRSSVQPSRPDEDRGRPLVPEVQPSRQESPSATQQAPVPPVNETPDRTAFRSTVSSPASRASSEPPQSHAVSVPSFRAIVPSTPSQPTGSSSGFGTQLTVNGFDASPESTFRSTPSAPLPVAETLKPALPQEYGASEPTPLGNIPTGTRPLGRQFRGEASIDPGDVSGTEAPRKRLRPRRNDQVAVDPRDVPPTVDSILIMTGDTGMTGLTLGNSGNTVAVAGEGECYVCDIDEDGNITLYNGGETMTVYNLNPLPISSMCFLKASLIGDDYFVDSPIPMVHAVISNPPGSSGSVQSPDMSGTAIPYTVQNGHPTACVELAFETCYNVTANSGDGCALAFVDGMASLEVLDCPPQS